MRKSKKPQIGDIYEVILEGKCKGYVQYIGNDASQLNSDVVRVFKKRFPLEQDFDLDEILNDEIEFYCHVTGMEFGEKDGSWKKIANSTNIGDAAAAFFRDAGDELEKRESGAYGMPEVSKTWYVWRMNQPARKVEELKGDNTNANIGMVTWPKSVVRQMLTGKWDGFYPAYK